jgi:hypothetical protein
MQRKEFRNSVGVGMSKVQAKINVKCG